MMKQKGQSAVELALIVPIFFTMCFGMIYGGMLFMDYLSINNSARAIARANSLSDATNRITLKESFEQKKGDYFYQMTKLYTATPEIIIGDDVTVTVELTLNSDGLPGVLSRIKFPPEKLNAVTVVMPIEKTD